MNRLTSDRSRCLSGSRPMASCLAVLGLAALCLVGSGSISGTARADTAADQRAQRRKLIAAMSESQRAALKRNWEVFRKLPSEDQEKLRRLDRELKEDARNQGQLGQVMHDYLAWLETLSPGQSEDLRREAAPDRREKLVRELMSEQQKRADPFSPKRLNGGFGPLAAKDLEAITAVVERHMREQRVRIGQLEEASSKTGLARNAAVLDLAFARGGPEGNGLMLSPEIVDEIVESIADANQRRWASDAKPQERFRRMFGLISSGLMAEFDKIKPDVDELHAFFATMKAEQQQELLAMPGRWQEFELMRRYMENHPEEPKPPQFGRWFGGFGGGFRGGPFGGGQRFGGRRGEGPPPPDGAPDRRKFAPGDEPDKDPPDKRGRNPGDRPKGRRGGPMG
ncbi:MAG: hypothetical protein EXS05_21980 [Planctomycetaceae bacterium]|nr:hypothetical protein [Planctomycetaceae bacterium]